MVSGALLSFPSDDVRGAHSSSDSIAAARPLSNVHDSCSSQAILSGNSHVVLETHFAAAALRTPLVNFNTHLVARECAACPLLIRPRHAA